MGFSRQKWLSIKKMLICYHDHDIALGIQHDTTLLFFLRKIGVLGRFGHVLHQSPKATELMAVWHRVGMVGTH